MNIVAITERVAPGKYAITATLDWNYDTDESTTLEAVSYRSTSGNPDEYVLLPWSIPKQTYKSPDTVDPWPKSIYKLKKCVISGEGMPEIVPYNKIIFRVTGKVDWSIELIAKLSTKQNVFG